MPHRAASPRIYFLVFASLLVLTLTTVVVAAVPLGAFHTPVALAIAGVKATLVVLFFMHALHSPKLTWAAILGSLFWLAIMIGLTMADYLTRGWSSGQY